MWTAAPTVRFTIGALVSFALIGVVVAGAVAAATPEEALREAVAATGSSYAGDCTGTRSPADLGTVCSRFVAERGELRAYIVGRTFSEFSEWLFLARTGAGWELAGRALLDFFDESGAVPWPR